MNKIYVLIIEDSIYSADLNIRQLRKAGFSVFHQIVDNEKSMLEALKAIKWDLILSDNSMPNFSALRAIELRNCENKNIPFIIVSEDICRRDIEIAFKSGCTAYVAKEELFQLRRVAVEVIRGKL